MSGSVHTIERMRVSHLTEIMPVERASYGTPWSVAMFVLELTRAEGIALGARAVPHEGESVGQLIGYLICSPQADEWHVMNVTVAPEHRGFGVARALMRELHETLDTATAGTARLTLEVRPTNEPALRLYASEGYLVAGRRRSYYPDNGEDALVMWRTPSTAKGRFDDVPAPDMSEARQWNCPDRLSVDPSDMRETAG
ncbi:MAG: ribosomal protein S18-alanine N-acetyltransferase [Solirubrobacteraceae bacterium]|nr:ribosomal protein S18-alanine N-acetyltransferase [Solirubrobacteraceae bacterium]